MKNVNLRADKMNLLNNTANEESRIASYEITDKYAIGFDPTEYFDARLPTKYTESGVAMDTPDEINVDVGGDIANTAISEDGGLAVAYVSEDGGSTWTRKPINGVNSWEADSNPNRVKVDVSDVNSDSNDVKVYYLFVPGELVLSDVPKPTFGQAHWSIKNLPLMELMNKDPLDKDSLTFIETTQKIPQDHILVLRLNSPEVVSWEDDALNQYVKLPLTVYEQHELSKTKEQLHNEIVSKLTQQV